MRFHEINESIEQVSILGKSVVIYRNPNELVLIAAVHKTRDRLVRGLVDATTGDTYWWNASLAIHPMVAKHLGLDEPYGRDHSARLELDGSQRPMILKVISGYDAAIHSSSLGYLTAKGNIMMGWNRSVIPFVEFVANVRRDRAAQSDMNLAVT